MTLRRSWVITTNTYKRRKVIVGTTKKSIAAMAPAWFWRKVRQLCDGRRPDLGRYFRIVAVEACRPSLASSSRIRGLPQVGLTLHIRRMSWINSRSFAGRPGRRLDFHRQNILSPARCQPMTVSGRKTINGVLQFGQTPLSIIQRHRSTAECGCRSPAPEVGADRLVAQRINQKVAA